MRVLAASTDAQSLITQIRVAVPLQAALAGHDNVLRLESFPYVRLADLAQAEVLVAQRGCAARHAKLMLAMRRRGGAVICEIDDLLTEPAPHLVHSVGMERSRKWVQQCLATAHVVTTSTPRLAEALKPFAQHIEVVPNYAHTLPHLPLHAPQLGKPCTVLLAASDSLAVTQLYPALRQLSETLGPALQIVAVGRAGDDAAAAGLSVQRHPLMPRDSFLMLARELPRVVAVIPLDDSRFSACKSAIKWFDYAEAGIPTITSNVPPYADVIENGRTGLLVEDRLDDWLAALRLAFDDHAWRTRVASAARERVRKHHHLGLTEAAWLHALDKAMSLRGADSAVQSRWEAGRASLTTLMDDTMVSIRRANRRRLERRRLHKQTAAGGGLPR